MSKLELVFVPAPAVGHLVSTCKFAEKLLDRVERLCITILIIRPPPPWDVSIDAYIKRSSSAPEGRRIQYITLPQAEPPPAEELAKSIENYFSLLIANYRPIVKEAIISNKWPDSNPKIIGLPPSSVLFLCFGSAGFFEPPQLIEMAIALEESGVRFLWSIRWPVDAEPTKFENLLPEGFLERTKNRGIACGWAPQVNIFAHEATGAFVSHCDWNSTAESVWHGVPILRWPLYAEQHVNAFQLVNDLETAVKLTLDYRMRKSDYRENVKAEDMEKSIRCIIDSENPMRKRVKAMGEICRKALMESGSSFNSMGRFFETILDS
ncbi:UDP-glycosyltransferase 71K3-like [Lycium ferocissimum]|uniref:UDP-glycosyltransferase 71K3-like n=1 Tax=Lycium ferocissimum TaxID=112874 RepID=UPI002814A84E|nr:UDP-glycosyltransferase 71K3-like [Lycium ferocissimum]